AEITRKLYHQGNAEGVLKTAATEIGANWRTARCIAALRKPGLPPSSVQEYHMEGLIPASAAALVSLVETLQDLAVARGTVTIDDATNAPELMDVRSAVEELQIESLLALPLTEGNDQIGVLILTQNTGRVWQPTAVMEQIGLLFSANIRTNDLAFRYEATTVALVLGDTGEKEALLAVEKLRR